jgi:glutamine amidotransferase/cyclase
MATEKKITVHLLDYGAGNVRSVRNAITANGYELVDIESPDDIEKANVIIFPGVGSFGTAMARLQEKGFVEPLKKYLAADKPFLGICLGMQTLFESSEESPNTPGLGFIPEAVTKFDSKNHVAVPQIGWNGRILHKKSPVLEYVDDKDSVYFVHSYYVPLTEQMRQSGWILATTTYGNTEYVSAVQKGNIVATQFHPEKSGVAGLNLIKGFLGVGTGTS